MAKRSRQESSNTSLFPAETSDENSVGTQDSLFPEQTEKPKKTVKRTRKSKSTSKEEQPTSESSPELKENQSVAIEDNSTPSPSNVLFEVPQTQENSNQACPLLEPNVAQGKDPALDHAEENVQEISASVAPSVIDSKKDDYVDDSSSVESDETSYAVEKEIESLPLVETVEIQETSVPVSEPLIDISPSPQDAPAKVNVLPTKSSKAVPTPNVEEKKPSAYQVVARRYRPQAFDELIGQETVARALSNAIETDRVGHAYLFTGARGVGKTSCARIFAKALNCVEGPTTHPCLKCDSCLGVATGEDVDVIEIDGASNRGVDEIRLLRQNATIAPSRSLYKIYIIDEVHMLTREAFNALLKTLEEPPARVKFIFCTTEPNKIPITILSRCQRFDFSGINGNSIANRLAQIAAQEGAQAEEGVFEILARRANGSMRDAQSLLEQLLSFAPNYISQAVVHNMLGSVDDKKIFDLLNATVDGNVSGAFEMLAEAANQGVDFGVLVEQTLGVYRDLMVVGSGCGAKELMYSPIARLAELQQTAQTLGMRRILASLQILDQTVQRIRFSTQPRILVELAFARLCRLDSFQAIESLILQLKQGAIPNQIGGVKFPSSDPSSNELKKK